jgi:peptidoglycan/LPS O-acetylase OafA/YrhL
MRYSLLDPLRGLAALWVFTHHYEFSPTFVELFPLVHTVFKMGDLGVPMFFVISGYCLTASAKSTMRNRQSPGNFIYRRALRIFPPYWLSIGVVAALPFVMELVSALKTGRFVPPSASQYESNGFLTFGLLDWLRLVTLTQVFTPLSGLVGPVLGGDGGLHLKFGAINAVYWSLAIEFQFYLVILLGVCLRARFYLALLLVTALCVPFALMPATYSLGVFLPFWPMFALGIALYWAFERQWAPDRLLGATAATGVAALVVGLTVAALAAGVYPGHFCFAALFVTALWFARRAGPRFDRLAQSRWWAVRLAVSLLLLLGAMSYSLYLLHNRLQFLVIQFGRQVLPVQSLVFDAFVLLATCALCYPFYRYCELPFYSSKKEKGPPPAPSKALAAGAQDVGPAAKEPAPAPV